MTDYAFPPSFRATDGDDNPLSGGTMRFFAATTTTPKEVFSNAARTVSLGTQVNINSAGVPVSGANTPILIYFGTGNYKYALYDSEGVLVPGMEFDNIPGYVEPEDEETTATPTIPVVSKTSAYTVVAGDRGKLINANPTGGSFAITLPSAVTVGDDFLVGFRHNGTANQVSLIAINSQIIRGRKNVTSHTLANQGDIAWLLSDGADWNVVGADRLPPPFFTVLDSLTAPPTSPDAGAKYRINGTPTGAWSTLGFAEEDIAEADGNGGWIRHTPQSGWLLFDQDVEEYLKFTESQWGPLLVPPEPSDLATAVFEHQLSNGTVGGQAVADTWTKRTINTSVQNDIDGCSLASSVITLPVGKYLINFDQFIWSANSQLASGAGHASRLKVTSGTATPTQLDAIRGFNSEDILSATAQWAGSFPFHGSGIIEVTEEVDLELQYYNDAGGTSTSELGIPTAEPDGGVEIYARVVIVSLSAQQGPQGDEGDPGTDGIDAGYQYQWSTLTSGDPGTGKVRTNHATPASVTQIAIHQTDRNSVDLTASIATWDDSTSDNKARIKWHKETAPENFLEFMITGAGTDAGDYWTFPVSYVNSAGTISNGNDVALQVVPVGFQGDPGTTVPDPSGLTVLDRTDLAPSHKLVAYDGATKTLHPTFALRVFDVSDPEFGAVAGSSAASATNVTAFQAAADAVDAAGGGTLYVPPGTWHIRSLVTLYSNTVVLLAAGAVVKCDVANWTGGNYVFRNENHGASSLTDTNIHLEGAGLIDMDGMDASTHAWYMRYVDTSSVRGCIAKGGGNFTAFLACVDTVTWGAEAQDVGNCAFDHWDGAGNAIVAFCTVRNSGAQGIQCTGTGSSFEDRDAWNVKFIGNTVMGVRDAGTASALIFNVNDAGSTVMTGYSSGNYVEDCDIGLVFSGTGGRHTSIGDTFKDVDELPIFIQDDGNDAPNDCRIINPHLIDCDHDAGNIALIVIAGDRNWVDGIRVTNSGAAPYGYVVRVISGAQNTFLGFDVAATGSSGVVTDAGTNTSILSRQNGSFIVGDAAGFALAAGHAASQIHGLTSIEATAANFRWSNDTGGAGYNFLKSRGATVGARAIVQSGDQLGFFSFAGDAVTNFVTAANIVAFVDGTPGTNDMPGRLQFGTTADGASSPTARMILDSVGALKPATDDGAVLGNSSLGWSDLYLAAGGQVRVNNVQVLTSRQTGWAAATGTATRTTFATGTVTTAQLAERVKALIDDLITHGVIGA